MFLLLKFLHFIVLIKFQTDYCFTTGTGTESRLECLSQQVCRIIAGKGRLPSATLYLNAKDLEMKY